MDRRWVLGFTLAGAMLAGFAWMHRYEVVWNRDRARVLDRWTGTICVTTPDLTPQLRCQPLGVLSGRRVEMDKPRQ